MRVAALADKNNSMISPSVIISNKLIEKKSLERWLQIDLFKNSILIFAIRVAVIRNMGY